ncbi:MAG: hypothetical protein EOO09_03580 [Chitinophagaceae bacterium]|nr:MAG: hypothetical protein EOO09_03580 [Chitinophagaceae bacterium]
MGRLFRRVFALLLHALLTTYLLTWILRYDLTDSWILFAGFVSLLLLLLFFFTLHVIAFFYFLKSRTKKE